MNDVVFKFIKSCHLSLISSKPLVTNYLSLLSLKPQLEVPLGQQGRIILSLYVDNMIITGDDVDGILVLKAELAK